MALYRRLRRPKEKHFFRDLAMMAAGFALGFVFSVVAFEVLNVQFHWIGAGRGQAEMLAQTAGLWQKDMPPGRTSGGADQALLALNLAHGAAPQNQTADSPQLLLTSEKIGDGYASPGQADVPLLNFSVTPSRDGFVHGMTFALGHLAHPYDLKSLKLFLKGDAGAGSSTAGQLLGEVSFFEGRGAFENLMVKVAANKIAEFSVVGTLSDQAQIGDRLVLGFADGGGISAIDSDGVDFSIQKNGTFSGPAVSVVRGR